MAQDYTTDCFSTAHVIETDMQNVEDNFEALRSNFSGSTAPASPVAFQFWANTSDSKIYIRTTASSWEHFFDAANKVLTKPLSSAAITSSQLGATCVKAANINAAAITSSHLNSSMIVSSHLTTACVTQTNLKTTTGSVAVSGVAGLPGGQYGFWPQINKSETSERDLIVNVYSIGSVQSAFGPGSYIYASQLCTATQRYVTASGDIHWLYFLRKKNSTEVIMIWEAPDHPSYGNGGKPKLIQHPFPAYDPAQHDIVVVTLNKKEREAIHSAMVVDDEDKWNLSFIKAFQKIYEIDENSSGRWPDQPVHVGFSPKQDQSYGEPIYRMITKPDCVTVKRIRRKV